MNNQSINVNPISQKGLLKYAMNKNEVDSKKFIDNDGDSDTDNDNDNDYSGFSKKMTPEEKAKKKAEFEKMKAEGKDAMSPSAGGGVRLPNRIRKGLTIDPNTGTAR